ncbi:FAD-binding protein [Corynebacterium sp. TAE3-ERU12]|uniref:D-arabinono-1,4-lactone oxidase n=1 Tax=Corynebacterium sp. TAE3-ERU12 TaxID=2849491 RepID=UPI001C44B81E|nr:D-arabinono-1,4-lactone oxidase [Corynebacterium sp. TAE3-ERU12]MBV7296202.1 FAD-binding protein [Corynebacterium sp. TAE3-ERU12]
MSSNDFAVWKNWAGTQKCSPASVHQPVTEADIAEIIHSAATRGTTVRPLGAGHSFTPVATTEGSRVQLDNMAGVVGLDQENNTVTLRAGTRLRDVPGLLRPLGLALPNQGDVDPQSVAGAVSTGTHGTGINFTGFAGMLRGFRLIDASGTAIDCHADADGIGAEIFRLGRLSLGMFGVLTELTLDVVPAFHLAADEHAEDFEELRANFPERVRATDHLEFYWFPGTDKALVKNNTRIDSAEVNQWMESPAARGYHRPSKVEKMRGAFADEVINNAALWGMCELAKAKPSLVPTLNNFAARTVAERKYVDTAHKVFVSPRRVRFAETEYSVPLDDAPEVISEIRDTIAKHNMEVSFPLEVRATAADDVPLSTSYGRQSCYIAVHRYHREPYRDYFGLIEPIFKAAQGRPHWGKLHTLTREDLQQRYPLFDEVAALREQVDPAGLFLNDHLRAMFVG